VVSRIAVANYQHIVAVGTSSRSWWLAKSESARPARRGRSDSSSNQNIAIGGVLWPWTSYNRESETCRPTVDCNFPRWTNGRIKSDIETISRDRRERVTRNNRWNSPASSPSTIDDNASREPRTTFTSLRYQFLQVLQVFVRIFAGIFYCRSPADYRAGASEWCTLRTHSLWIVAHTRMHGGYSANGTFRIILLVVRWPIKQKSGRDRF